MHTISNMFEWTRSVRARRLGLSVLMLVVALTLLGAGLRFFQARLSGAAEVPGPGDPDGFGRARITLHLESKEVCFRIDVRRIAPATAAHIHVGNADEAGPVIVGLEPPASGHSEGCVSDVPSATLRAINTNPSGYYVNVHNEEFPAGALRGQLSR